MRSKTCWREEAQEVVHSQKTIVQCGLRKPSIAMLVVMKNLMQKLKMARGESPSRGIGLGHPTVKLEVVAHTTPTSKAKGLLIFTKRMVIRNCLCYLGNTHKEEPCCWLGTSLWHMGWYYIVKNTDVLTYLFSVWEWEVSRGRLT